MQQGSLTVSQYHTHFKSTLAALASQGGALSHNAGVMRMVAKEMLANNEATTDDITKMTDAQKGVAKARAHDRYVAALFLKLADPHRFGDYLLSLKDDYTAGLNKFPETLQKAVELLQGRENNRQGQRKPANKNPNQPGKNKQSDKAEKQAVQPDGESGGVSFYTQSKQPTKEAAPDNTDASTISTKKTTKTVATKGGKTGSISVNVGSSDSVGSAKGATFHTFTFVTNGFIFTNSEDRSIIPNTWILLDNQSTVNVFCNPALLDDIHDVDDELVIHSNGGISVATQMGTLRGFGNVWYDPNAIANIVSMHAAEQRGFLVEYSTAHAPTFRVTKQKLNTKSSTEGELVGVDDAMPRILWTRYFIIAQGYSVDPSILYQDNQSTILLAENGTASSSKRTRHVAIRYYFITDRVNKGEIRIEYCPTKEMIADFFTKPLQGALFYKLRGHVLNLPNQDGASPLSMSDSATSRNIVDNSNDEPQE